MLEKYQNPLAVLIVSYPGANAKCRVIGDGK